MLSINTAPSERRIENFSLIKNLRSRDSNPGRRYEKRDRYHCAMPTPLLLLLFVTSLLKTTATIDELKARVVALLLLLLAML